ncbi:MAG TPA: hypothetical protein VKA47_07700 [Solirubrobacterales bacterium]|nr:hypothetical protein [Solirubrobacterales bacterium]
MPDVTLQPTESPGLPSVVELSPSFLPDRNAPVVVLIHRAVSGRERSELLLAAELGQGNLRPNAADHTVIAAAVPFPPVVTLPLGFRALERFTVADAHLAVEGRDLLRGREVKFFAETNF